MCHPAVAVIATVISTAVSMYGAKQQADSAQAQADYQAAVDRNNATIAQNNAEQATEDARVTQTRAADTAAEHMDKVRRLSASQNAATAGSGLMVNTGSALDLLDQTNTYGAIDAGRIRANGQLEANNLLLNAQAFKQQSSDFTSSAANKTWQGQQAQAAGTVSMIGSGVKGASSVYGEGYKAKWWGN